MRNFISGSCKSFLVLALCAASACATEDATTDQTVDEADQSVVQAPTPEAADADALSLPDGAETNAGCSCYTTCSSNGKGWTRTYHVGHANNASNCSTLAAGYCRSLASDYRFHNSACT